MHKAQREVAAHHKFRELCRSFVEVNEKICRLRPVEQEQEPAASLTPRKKTMRYPRFRKQGLLIGSGVIEAGCKTVVAQRLKRSGMFWTVRGANAIVVLRCARLSGRFEDYWESAPKPPDGTFMSRTPRVSGSAG